MYLVYVFSIYVPYLEFQCFSLSRHLLMVKMNDFFGFQYAHYTCNSLKYSETEFCPMIMKTSKSANYKSFWHPGLIFVKYDKMMSLNYCRK